MTTQPVRPFRPPTPPFLKRRVWIYGALITLAEIALIAAILFWPALVSRLPLPSWVRWASFGALLPYSIAIMILIWWYNSAFNEVHRRAGAGELPCWDCGYDLTNLGASGTCPECGNAFVAVETRERWTPTRPGREA